MRPSVFAVLLMCVAATLSAADDIEKTIKNFYASSQQAARDARTKDDLTRALSTFAPEWVGNKPAGETLTLADLIKEGESVWQFHRKSGPSPNWILSSSAKPAGTSR